MKIKVLNPFNDTKPALTTDLLSEAKRYASQLIKNLKELSVGEGSKTLKVDKDGFWLGAARFADAPFKVDMEGNLTATSVTLSGYIATGGAAADVNDNPTTVDGGKITANTIDANRIKASTLTAAVNVGSGAGGAYLQMDGPNNRFIVHDGTREIILMGYQLNGF